MGKSSVSEKKKVITPRHTMKVLILLLILLAVCIVASLAFGSRMVAWTDVLDGLFHPEVQSHEANVVRQRIARTIFSVMCGAALGVSGALMQSVTRNPIADPSILGVNMGASLFIVCGIAFLNIHSANEYIWLAIAGAMITAIFVFGIGSGVISGLSNASLGKSAFGPNKSPEINTLLFSASKR